MSKPSSSSPWNQPPRFSIFPRSNFSRCLSIKRGDGRGERARGRSGGSGRGGWGWVLRWIALRPGSRRHEADHQTPQAEGAPSLVGRGRQGRGAHAPKRFGDDQPSGPRGPRPGLQGEVQEAQVLEQAGQIGGGRRGARGRGAGPKEAEEGETEECCLEGEGGQLGFPYENKVSGCACGREAARDSGSRKHREWRRQGGPARRWGGGGGGPEGASEKEKGRLSQGTHRDKGEDQGRVGRAGKDGHERNFQVPCDGGHRAGLLLDRHGAHLPVGHQGEAREQPVHRLGGVLGGLRFALHQRHEVQPGREHILPAGRADAQVGGQGREGGLGWQSRRRA